jgi:DNA-directed RNA polymerase subunit RPC12/RpoP
MAEKRRCPNCGSIENSRSHRTGLLEKYILGVLGVRPYRCMNCDVRFYAFSRFDEESSQTNKAA